MPLFYAQKRGWEREIFHAGRFVAANIRGSKNNMLKYLWIAPLLMLAGCSKGGPPPAANAAVNGGAAGAAASQPGSVAGNPEPTAPQPAPAAMLIPRGSEVRVRLDQEIDTRRNRAGDRFAATLYEPVIVNGAIVLPAGTLFHGHLIVAKPSGRLRGRAELGLTLDSFRLDGRDYTIDTSGAYRESRSHKRHNFTFIGGGSGVGAAIGAIAGGGAGAAIGALAGGGAGVAGAAVTGRKQVALATEAPLVFTLREPVRI
jgi:hypothetical protein